MGVSDLFLLNVSGKKITDDSFESEQKLGGGGIKSDELQGMKRVYRAEGNCRVK